MAVILVGSLRQPSDTPNIDICSMVSMYDTQLPFHNNSPVSPVIKVIKIILQSYQITLIGLNSSYYSTTRSGWMSFICFVFLILRSFFSIPYISEPHYSLFSILWVFFFFLSLLFILNYSQFCKPHLHPQ